MSVGHEGQPRPRNVRVQARVSDDPDTVATGREGGGDGEQWRDVTSAVHGDEQNVGHCLPPVLDGPRH